MTDDIVTRLRNHVHGDFEKTSEFMLGLAADEIERLRSQNTELVKMFKQVGVVAEMWQKSEDELIELHHGKCAEQFAKQADEIERLRADRDKWRGLAERAMELLEDANRILAKIQEASHD